MEGEGEGEEPKARARRDDALAPRSLRLVLTFPLSTLDIQQSAPPSPPTSK